MSGILGRSAGAPTQAQLSPDDKTPASEASDQLLLSRLHRPGYRAEAKRRNLL